MKPHVTGDLGSYLYPFFLKDKATLELHLKQSNFLLQDRLSKVKVTTLDFPALAAAIKDGTSNLSPGPKMLLGRMQHVSSPLIPFAFKTRRSPSAFVAEYESLCLKINGQEVLDKEGYDELAKRNTKNLGLRYERSTIILTNPISQINKMDEEIERKSGFQIW